MDIVLPKSRSEAVRSGSKFYFNGVPCKHGHVGKRRVTGGCHACWKLIWKRRQRLLILLGREAAEKALQRPLTCESL